MVVRLTHLLVVLAGLALLAYAVTFGSSTALTCRGVPMRPGSVCQKADGSQGQTYEQRLATRRAARPVVVGMGLLVAGFGTVLLMRSHFNTQADFNTILIPTVLQGAAMAFFFIPLQAIVFSGLTPDRMPAAAGLSNFARITAGASSSPTRQTAATTAPEPAAANAVTIPRDSSPGAISDCPTSQADSTTSAGTDGSRWMS